MDKLLNEAGEERRWFAHQAMILVYEQNLWKAKVCANESLDMKEKEGVTMKIRRRFLIGIFVAMFMPIFLLCASEALALKNIAMTTGVDTSFCQIPIAIEKGYFKKYGLEVTVKKFMSGTKGFRTVLAGENDASISATPAVIAALAQGANIRVIGTSRAATGAYSAIVATADIKKPEDLYGRKVGIHWGSSGSHMFFLLYTKYHKLDRSKMDIKQLQAQEAMVAFSRGDVDAYAAWPPWWSRGLKLREGAHVLAYSNDNNVSIGTQVVSVSGKLAEDREAVKGFARAIIDAEKYLKDHHEDAVKLLAKEYEMTEAEIESELKEQTHRLELSEITVQDFCNSIRFMIELKKVEKAPIWNNVILTDILKEVAPSRITYEKSIDCR